ncbi:hypothetical protein FAM09_12690 [Niastella caeni]|uniref:O-antigen ligase family protein n=1 Tax=Niastella caeni TaxID=2569763 RepID=A0A4S8I120_9BACT|nr:hypothetical protein [Niastella caeni]THU39362.1 hypothetical protein FAM09_12690 [Niastella caeni]
MTTFLLIIEYIFFFGLAIYCILKKNELSIFYLPVLFFVDKIVSVHHPAFLYYGLVCLLILMLMKKNGFFFRNNIWALFLIIYFLILLTKSSDLGLIRPYVFSVTWLFLLIALIPNIYKKYPAAVVFKELSNASLLILVLFIVNALAATFYKFSPTEMYGITSGILFGNLWAAAFNTLPIALFVAFLYGVSEKKPVHVIISVVSFFFIMLTLRRTVIALSLLGIVISLMTMLTRQKAKMLFVTGGLIVVIGYLIYANTSFMSEFKERVELRKLDERELAEEKRFFEYSLLYDDMFIYHAYSPWFGFELFNSGGNYGKGVLADRSLHGDIPNLLHSSGIVGVILYLLMIGTAFWQALRAAVRYQDKLVFLFCGISFLVYTISGRYTEVAATLLIFLVLLSPIAQQEEPAVDVDESKAV